MAGEKARRQVSERFHTLMGDTACRIRDRGGKGAFDGIS